MNYLCYATAAEHVAGKAENAVFVPNIIEHWPLSAAANSSLTMTTEQLDAKLWLIYMSWNGQHGSMGPVTSPT
jgi:hypothetical protein